MQKMPARFSTTTMSAGIRREVSISNKLSAITDRNSWIALSKNLSVTDRGDMPEEACLGLGERKRLLMIVPCSLCAHFESWRLAPSRRYKNSWPLPLSEIRSAPARSALERVDPAWRETANG